MLENSEMIEDLLRNQNLGLFFFKGFIDEKFKQIILKFLKNRSFKNLLIILNSKGGLVKPNPINQNSLIEDIKSEMNGNELYVLIYKEVASLATLIAFSADKLFYLNDNCLIGPLDPQIGYSANEIFDITVDNNLSINRLISKRKKYNDKLKEHKDNFRITIEQTVNSLKTSKVIEKKRLKDSFIYLMNKSGDFKNDKGEIDHSGRKTLKEVQREINPLVYPIDKILSTNTINLYITYLKKHLKKTKNQYKAYSYYFEFPSDKN